MQSWKKFEYRVRDAFLKRGFKAYRIPVSGSSSAIKSDVVAEKGSLKLRVDAKSTVGKGEIRLSREAFEKIKKEAKGSEISIVIFSFYLHRNLYAVVEKNLLGGWSGRFSNKHTRASGSIGLKKNETAEATENKGGIEFRFKGGTTSYALVRLSDLLEFLEIQRSALP